MENTNRMLNVTTRRNAKLVKCKVEINFKRKKSKIQTIQVFTRGPILLATASSLIHDKVRN